MRASRTARKSKTEPVVSNVVFEEAREELLFVERASFEQPEPPSQKKTFSRTFLALLILLVFAGGYRAWVAYRSPLSPDQEVEKVVAEVSLLVVLPRDEKPTLATVSDPEKLHGQEFFKNAEAGDKVLLYSSARKAILYSPRRKKIVEIAPITTSAVESQGEPAGS